ncbi:hypothetical protein H0Z60_08340 [Ectothiorhodospiraceae bacterium WFHF3C12]|nr:hypothetical protein [Ectothiorhodospiraceae bacterium WFHF3C12]
MNWTMKRLALGSAAMMACLFFSTSAFALNGGGGGGEGFAELFNEAEDDGPCSVNRVSGLSSTYYIPSGGSGQYNVLVWGNGTGGTSLTYSSLLESVASHCIAVAAANTSNSGTGEEMQSALNGIRSRYGSILGQKVCTAGHSQGGGGSFNAANRIGADCVIPVQPDTVFTTRIYSDLASHVEVITLWGESDTLAPASTNRGNVEDASSILTQVETDGEGHFAPTSGRGGDIGTMFRMANIAQLSNDASRATRFRQAFWGPDTDFTVTESNSAISDVRRDSGARATQP